MMPPRDSAVERGEGEVVAHRHRQHQALGLAVLRDQRHADAAGAWPRAGCAMRHRLAVDPHLAARRRAARRTAPAAARAGPGRRGRRGPTISPAPQLKRDVVAAGRPSSRPRTSSTGGAGSAARRGLRRKDVAVFAADHQLDDLARRSWCPPRRSRRCGRCGTPCSRRPARRSRACGARCRASARPSRAQPLQHARRPSSTSAAVSAEVASSRIRMRGLRASALAISTIWRRDSGRSLHQRAADGCPRAPARASASSAMRRCAARSIRPKRARRIG